jgi:A/G-specific adenine glycosylase
MPSAVTPKIRRAFHQDLMAWYDRHRRDLPWRRSRDPYAIVVSEFMLQQTQVATVIPYYQRWLEAFPDWESLAQAGEPQVLKAWEGLGYYRRARFLHQLAREVAGNLQGRLPQDAAALRQLPGIGPYMAGAVASIAFGQKTPLVDGNVERILARIFAISDPTEAPATKKRMWALADELLPDLRPGDFNQALMELGATLCTPRNPTCLLCPVKNICQAADPHDYPVKKKVSAVASRRTYAVVVHRKKIWLLSPGTSGLWKGLPRLPEWDARWMNPGLPKGECSIGITVHRIRASVLLTSPLSTAPLFSSPDGHWHPLSSLGTMTLPAPHRRMILMALPPSDQKN